MLTNREHRISFDSTGRLISKELLDLSVTGNADKWLHSLEYNYDLNNNITHFAFADKNVSFVTAYEYGKDNLPTKTILDNEKNVTNTYDNLGRLTGKNLDTTNAVNISYTYHDSGWEEKLSDGITPKYTTTKLETEETPAYGYMYEYDVLGNITEIYEGTKVTAEDGTESYVYDTDTQPAYKYYYDAFNQLIRVRDGNAGLQTEYTYDESGNITSKSTRGWDQESSSYTSSEVNTITYSYDDSNGWGDLLTSYNGETITYDAIGNPLSYRDGISLTWQNGRRLATYSQTDGASVSYTYDVDGMRTGKTVTSGTTTDTVEYVYENGLLLQMRYNHMIFNFSYDAYGAPVSMAYRMSATATPTYYYYGLNSSGDVIALYNSSGNLLAKYTYDAYGKCLSVISAAGATISAKYAVPNLNPLRYRGYVYDNETGFYYLQSRYYDPETCRFVNGDDTSYLGVNGFNSYNLYAYCNNNPIIHIDSLGTWAVAIYPIAGSASAIIGLSINIGFAFDDNGNFDVLLNYAIPFVNDTYYYGFIGAGGCIDVQWYNVDSVSDLYGYSDGVGVSAGPNVFGGFDMMYDSTTGEAIGGQIFGGYGASAIPVDVHKSRSYTISLKNVFGKEEQSVSKSNANSVDSYVHKLTVKERRLGAM